MTSLLKYDAARRALAEAKAIDEVKDIRDKAEALRTYARLADDVELEKDCAEIRLRAERRFGEMKAEMVAAGTLHHGGRPAKTGDNMRPVLVTLEDLGVDKRFSARSDKMAGIAERAFEAAVAGVRERIAQRRGRVSLDILKDQTRQARQNAYRERIHDGGTVDDLQALAASGFRAGAILADPPWKFAAWGANGEDRSASQHYDTRKLDAIVSLPVRDLAAKDAILGLWTVDWDVNHAMAFAVIKAWGFEHKTTFLTWVKLNASGEGYFIGQGYWTRANPEVCLLATRGHPKRIHADVQQLIVSEIGEHSEKPDETNDRIMRLVDGPYLELYARRKRRGWKTWGNEIAPPRCDVPHDPQTGEILESVGYP